MDENKQKCTFLDNRETKLLVWWIINAGPCTTVIMRSGTGEKQMAWGAQRAEKEARAPDNAGTDWGSDELSRAPNENELLFELSFFFFFRV